METELKNRMERVKKMSKKNKMILGCVVSVLCFLIVLLSFLFRGISVSWCRKGSEYVFLNKVKARGFGAARSLCELQNGDLAVIQTVEEAEFVASFLNKKKRGEREVYLGLNGFTYLNGDSISDNSDSFATRSGVFPWDGSSGPLEGDDCVISNKDTKWEVVDCDQSLNSLCERHCSARYSLLLILLTLTLLLIVSYFHLKKIRKLQRLI